MVIIIGVVAVAVAVMDVVVVVVAIVLHHELTNTKANTGMVSATQAVRPPVFMSWLGRNEIS